jgi:hypothetical protein
LTWTKNVDDEGAVEYVSKIVLPGGVRYFIYPPSSSPLLKPLLSGRPTLVYRYQPEEAAPYARLERFPTLKAAKQAAEKDADRFALRLLAELKKNPGLLKWSAHKTNSGHCWSESIGNHRYEILGEPGPHIMIFLQRLAGQPGEKFWRDEATVKTQPYFTLEEAKEAAEADAARRFPLQLLAKVKENPKARENGKRKYSPCMKWEPVEERKISSAAPRPGPYFRTNKGDKTYYLRWAIGPRSTLAQLYVETEAMPYVWAKGLTKFRLLYEIDLPVRNIIRVKNRVFAWADSFLCDPLEILARAYKNPYADPYANTPSKYHGWLESPGGLRYQLNLDKLLHGRIVIWEDSLGKWWGGGTAAWTPPFTRFPSREAAFEAADVWLEKNVDPLRLLAMTSRKNPRNSRKNSEVELHQILSQYPWTPHTYSKGTAYTLALVQFDLTGFLVIRPSDRIASEDLDWWSVTVQHRPQAVDVNLGQVGTLKRAFAKADGWLEEHANPVLLLAVATKTQAKS